MSEWIFKFTNSPFVFGYWFVNLPLIVFSIAIQPCLQHTFVPVAQLRYAQYVNGVINRIIFVVYFICKAKKQLEPKMDKRP